MKHLKKLLSVVTVLSFTLTLCNSNTAKANSELSIKTIDSEITNPKEISEYVQANFAENTVTINEVDYLEQIQSHMVDELVESGMSQKQAESILNYDYKEELLDMAKESVDDLKSKGFNNRQINAIKSYDGSTNALNYAKNNSLSSASLTMSWGPTLINNTQQFNIYYYAKWSSQPIFNYSDIIGIGWIACNKNSMPITMKHNDPPTCFAQYYEGNTYITIKNLNASEYDASSATFKIPMLLTSQVDDIYAKEISGSVRLATQSGSKNLYSIQVLIGYGHVVVIPSASISFYQPTSMSINFEFSYNVEQLYKDNKIYKYDGTLL